MPKLFWTREKDLELIRLIFEGLTQEGIEARSGVKVSLMARRLMALGITMAAGRKAKRQGITPEALLDASPVYKAEMAEQPPLPFDKPLFDMATCEGFEKLDTAGRIRVVEAMAEVIRREQHDIEISAEAGKSDDCWYMNALADLFVAAAKFMVAWDGREANAAA